MAMTFWVLIRRSLRFHARTHLGVLSGAVIGSAALIGALIVGDSVKGSLRERALARLGTVAYGMSTGDRFFLRDLNERIEAGEVHSIVPSGTQWVKLGSFGSGRAALMQLAGTASRADGTARANQVNVLGLDAVGWAHLAEPGTASVVGPDAKTEARSFLERAGISVENQAGWEKGEVVFVNQALAKKLGVTAGAEIVLRVRKPSLLAQDAVITPRDEGSLAFRLKVGAILSPAVLGEFSLLANQVPAENAFLCLDPLGAKLQLPGRANLLLSSEFLALRQPGWLDRQRLWMFKGLARRNHPPGSWSLLPNLMVSAPDTQALTWLTHRLDNSFSLGDAQLSMEAVQQPEKATGGELVPPAVELRSSRIFLEPDVVAAALRPRTVLLTQNAGFEKDRVEDVAASGFVTNGTGILTYLANLLEKGDRATPYSMITAAGAPYVPADMRNDEILINSWLADDLQARPGDNLQVSYYAVDSGSRLIQRTNNFHVREILPMKGIYADRTLMPEFPGVAKAESTHDWDTGFPLTYKIREKDEAYWKQYRGTPKAFITLAAGQAMWTTRFGNLTAIRYQVPTNASAQTYRDLAYRNVLANVSPGDFGFRFEPVRQQALNAANQSQDFGQLFIGFSLFLVVAAMLLMGLLFQFSLEQRQAEVGTLLALGLRPKQVRRLLLGEAFLLALLGGVLGTGVGIGYAKAMVWGLTTVWRDAIGGATLQFHASSASLATGLFAGVLVALFTCWLTLRKQARRPARELLSGESSPQKVATGRVARWISLASGVCGAGVVIYAVARRETGDAEAFFEAGSLLLIAGISAASAWLSALAGRGSAAKISFGGLGLRGCVRRRKRSLVTIALLACGSFVIISIGAFHLDANQDALKRNSGTGGFALIGQAAFPVIQDLDTEAGRDFFGLSANDLTNVSVVQFRVRQGDQASCLNLNRAQRPQVLGVNPERLRGRFTFTAAAKGLDVRQGWDLLKNPDGGANSGPPDEIRAVGDANALEWALHKKVGETMDYTDEQGRSFKLRLVGAVANSVLQGNLVIDEAEFVRRFPSESGYRFFLVDAPAGDVPKVSATLARALQDVGLDVTRAADRLNEFNAVQNTYLGTFQILGGLGLLLGSAGLGVVVMRNVFERRGELGVLLAVGFRKRALQWLVLAEHGALLGLGLGLGLVAAFVAVLPALLSPARPLPYTSMAITLGAVVLNGAVWTWLATRAALRGNLLSALRNE